ncbi:uncharacterized protein B0P05DRAFT_560082 [Gilbertella persicaria]|uniref:uncharacterized protein n=1 Tax=Gilbertella persicaria TaxID=101096 RepID=UPI00222069ED|nr:uncharacterized protein B0P05DRAFT_560082 [Gilbertella persicaria]KAI8056538.1 hypothetical protein B0P05DRAFT_560082 [Gilbertella persicaria]
MSISPYEFENHHLIRKERLPSIKRIFDSIQDSVPSQAPSPPDLLHDSDEDDGDSLCTPSVSSSPHAYHDPCNRKKTIPYKSPSVAYDTTRQAFDNSVVFQLNLVPSHAHANVSNMTNQGKLIEETCDFKCTSHIVCGQSILSALRRRVAHARSHLHQTQPRLSHKRTRYGSMVQIPKPKYRRIDTDSEENDVMSNDSITSDLEHKFRTVENQYHNPHSMDQISTKHEPTKRTKNPAPTGRPTRVKGPCQACQEASDGCMRKAFNWPFSTNQTFSDKGKPFVYLCNKCGLRYNKSNGCVCRHCRWVFCKEEKRKALQHIEAMRRSRPDGRVDPNENIENFVCSPKYWTCGKPWKVGWVLNSLNEDDDEDALFSFTS